MLLTITLPWTKIIIGIIAFGLSIICLFVVCAEDEDEEEEDVPEGYNITGFAPFGHCEGYWN